MARTPVEEGEFRRQQDEQKGDFAKALEKARGKEGQQKPEETRDAEQPGTRTK